MIAYSGSARIDEKGQTIVSGKPEELDWLFEQLKGVEARRNTKNSATVPLAKMKELHQANPKKIVAVQ